MFRMKTRINSTLAVAATLLFCVSVTQAQQPRASTKTAPAHATGDVARGKYIVEQVAMCGQCHTPRDANGHLDASRPLQGAPVFMVPMGNDPNWPLVAPRIGGTPP